MISSAEDFENLRASKSLFDGRRLVWEEAPDAVWHDIIERFPDSRTFVAQNQTLPLSILRTIACDVSVVVRRFVARKPRLPLDLQEQMAHDLDEGVRDNLAHNAKTEKSVLRILSGDPVASIALVSTQRLANLEKGTLNNVPVPVPDYFFESFGGHFNADYTHLDDRQACLNEVANFVSDLEMDIAFDRPALIASLEEVALTLPFKFVRRCVDETNAAWDWDEGTTQTLWAILNDIIRQLRAL